MQTYVYLLVFLHIADGCKLLDYSQITIEGLSGGSAVLPCSCADPQATVSNLRWQYRKKNVVGGFNDIYPTDKTQRFKSLIQLVNAAAPGNFSLHISHLTAEDEGLYQCQDKNQTSNYRLVTLQVKFTATVSTPRPGSGTKTTPSTPRPVTPKPNGGALSTPEAGSNPNKHPNTILNDHDKATKSGSASEGGMKNLFHYLYFMVPALMVLMLLLGGALCWTCRAKKQKEAKNQELQRGQRSKVSQDNLEVLYSDVTWKPAKKPAQEAPKFEDVLYGSVNVNSGDKQVCVYVALHGF
ncbi:hypothetical protein HF521_008214 [Silurus meridionalis]|uniref:Ig-like domain-containing protein n=1 Tax=Silurus meridionalis TaxID=175797 RepID=A0A8T0AR35_SILME|nr:hypothetical protein HF521_008214 [Silurus meridionalis]